MRRFLPLTTALLLIILSGCASAPPPQPSPPVKPKPRPAPVSHPAPTPAPAPKPTPPTPVAPPVAPAANAAQQTRQHLLKLLPPQLADRNGWAVDLQQAFQALNIAPSRANLCAVLAVIEQESNYQADPAVPGLPNIVQKEIQARSDKYHIPDSMVEWMLARQSQDGRSYQQRINALKTERELSDLVEEMMTRLPGGNKLLHNYNPVRTGGPMQVSVAFAEEHVRSHPYPYPLPGSVRSEVFTRRGGLYFGSAILLDYPAPYSDPLYRFADFNAGRYSSRNAAFQLAVSRISGKNIGSDGDLLRYKNGQPDSEPSQTLLTLLDIRRPLRLAEADIRRDILLEKSPNFSQTVLYQRVFELADGQRGPLPRTAMPGIQLHSPKFTRKLTTEWFATRVQRRYNNCLQRDSKSGK